VHSELNIVSKMDENIQIILFNISSRKILQKQFMHFLSLNISEFEQGIYIYEIRRKSGLLKKGLVIKD
jgi:geranylgeranyl pyrophosphate synthase